MNLPVREVADTEALMQSPSRFLNRELSWVRFNLRVLEEAENVNHPVFERLRFLSISASNLDEFYMVRVAGLRAQVHSGVTTTSIDGLTPAEQLEKIHALAGELMLKQQRLWGKLKTAIGRAGVKVLEAHQVNKTDEAWLRGDFLKHTLPVITPLAIDPAHPFPFIPNLGFALALQLRKQGTSKVMNALIPLPSGVKRFVELPTRPRRDGGRPDRRFISLESVLTLFANTLFPGYEVVGKGAFRVIRDSDIEVEEESEDLMLEFENLLKQRRRGVVVRLTMDSGMPPALRDLIVQHLHAQPQDIVPVTGLLGLAQISQLIPDDRPEHTFTPYEPRYPERIRDHGGNCFSAIREKDIIVHHP